MGVEGVWAWDVMIEHRMPDFEDYESEGAWGWMGKSVRQARVAFAADDDRGTVGAEIAADIGEAEGGCSGGGIDLGVTTSPFHAPFWLVRLWGLPAWAEQDAYTHYTGKRHTSQARQKHGTARYNMSWHELRAYIP